MGIGSKSIQKVVKNVSADATDDVLSKTLASVVTDNAIDTTKKGFGKQLLSGVRSKVFNSDKATAQSIVDNFPMLFRADYGDSANDLIKTLSHDGGAVLSGFASNPKFNMSKTKRTLGISRDSFDKFFNSSDNSFLANAGGEIIGSPRASEYYKNGAVNAQDTLGVIRDTILDTAEKNNALANLPSYSGADDYAAALLENLYGNRGFSGMNEFKMPMSAHNITSVQNLGEDAARKLSDDAVLTLANGETITVPANSLFGGFDGVAATGNFTMTSGLKEAIKNDPRKAIYDMLKAKYGDEAANIMQMYGRDLDKKKANAFLSRLLTGQDVEAPLVQYHGVSPEKLKKILDLSEETYSDVAIPNPSLQIVDPTKNSGTKYGDIVLLGNKSIPGGINQYSKLPDMSGKYQVYSRDIYSPRQPQISYTKGTPVIEGTRKLATPENLSEYMNKQGTKAVESTWANPGSMAATQAKRFRDPLEVVQNSDLLAAQNELDTIFEQWNNDTSGAVSELLDKYLKKNPDVNQYSYADYISSELQDAMAGKRGWDDPYGIWTTEEGRRIVAELKDKASKLPTAYFEAKANRAVPLSEFGGVVLPEGFSDPVIEKALEDAGLQVMGRYNPENYDESLKSVLTGLLKKNDRLSTPYIYSTLGALLGGGALLASANRDNS